MFTLQAGKQHGIVGTLQGGGRRGHRIDAEAAAGGQLIAWDAATVETFITHALTSEGADASEGGTGRGTPLVVAAPLTAGSATSPGVNRPGRRQEDDINLVAFAVAGDYSTSTDIAQTIRAANGQPGGISDDTTVRRLTPVECERLQGFPDGWTAGQSDSARYRQLGNAVAVPVAEWIARRITGSVSE